MFLLHPSIMTCICLLCFGVFLVEFIFFNGIFVISVMNGGFNLITVSGLQAIKFLCLSCLFCTYVVNLILN
jgi:hypothetical protein